MSFIWDTSRRILLQQRREVISCESSWIMGGAREAHGVWHLELQFLSWAPCLIYHLLSLPPSFQSCVHFPGSPFSHWFGGHLFSLCNRIIFFPSWKVWFITKYSGPGSDFPFSLCIICLSLELCPFSWKQESTQINKGHRRRESGWMNGFESCTWVFPFCLADFTGRNSAHVIRYQKTLLA